MPLAVEIRNLSKEFSTDFWKPKVKALENVSFQVSEGAVFGLIGHNGAGKTTTIKILLGLIRPTKGDAEIFGRASSEVLAKKDVGYLPENAYYYDFLKPNEVLDFYGRLFGLTKAEREKRTDMLLELVGLRDRRNLRLRGFSKGMLQRMGIAQALINDPKIVVFDEPMSGLDPIGRKEVRDIILRLVEQKKTILFSSHILSDVEAICDDVAILVRGQLVASGPLSTLVKAKIKEVEVIFHGNLPENISGPGGKASVRKVSEQVIVSIPDMENLPDVLHWGKTHHLSLVSVIPHKESLEDLFLEKTVRKT